VNGSWSGAQSISADVNAEKARIGVDNAGFVSLTWRDGNNGAAYVYRDPSSGSFSSKYIIPGSNGAGLSSIAVDKDNGDVHIAYSKNFTELHYAKGGRGGTNFSDRIVVNASNQTLSPRIAWSANGRIIIAYDDNNKANISAITSEDRGANWDNPGIVASPGGGAEAPWVVADTIGGGYIVYAHRSNSSVYLTTMPGQSPTPVITSGPGNRPTECNVGRVIEWATQVSSSSFVEYGATTAYGSIASGPSGTSHSVTLTNLQQGMQYHFRVRSDTTSGTATSGDGVFIATDTGFTCWSSQGGILSEAPAGTDLNGTLYVFAVGVDPQNPAIHPLYFKTSTDGTNFSAYQSLGGNLTSAPAAASFNGRLYVFASGVDTSNPTIHPLYARSFDGHAWTDWSSLGGNLTDAPAAATFGGRLYAFAKGVDPQNSNVYPLYVKSSVDGSNFDEWRSLGGNLTAAPAAASYTPTGGVPTLAVFARGTEGALYIRRSMDGINFTDWSSLYGNLKGAPAATSFHGSRLYVFARGSDDAMYERHTP